MCIAWDGDYAEYILVETEEGEDSNSVGGLSIPTHQQAIQWILKKLVLKYPTIILELYPDFSGYIKVLMCDVEHSSFKNLNELLFKLIKLC